MSCGHCGSDRVASVSGKCEDMCHIVYKENDEERNDYVPKDMGIGRGDYLRFSYCLECGMIQGDFPIADPLWYEMRKEEEDVE